MALEDLTYRDYFDIFRRRWKLALAAAVVGGAAGVALARFQTPVPVYEASASVSYDPGSGFEVAPGPRPAGGALDLTPQIFFIRSLQIMGSAARRLGVIPEDTPREEYERHIAAIGPVRWRVEAIPDPKGRSGLITIKALNHSAERAAATANAVAFAYHDENVYEMKKHIVRRREFIEKQLAVNEKAMNEAQLGYERYRREHPMALESTVGVIAQQEAILANAAAKIDEIRRQLSLVQVGRPISDLGLQAIVASRSTARLTQLSTAYTRLSLERSRLLTELTEVHPLVLRKEEEIDGVRGELETELLLILEAFEKQREEQLAKAEEIRKLEAGLPEEAMQLARLAREAKIYENLLLQLRTQLEETLLREAGVSGQVTILAPAATPTEPVNPPAYLRLGALGLAGGLFAGLVLGVVLETARVTRRTLREVEEALDVPILGVNPRATPQAMAAWLPGRVKLRRGSPEWSRSLTLAVLLAPRSPFGEAFRTLRANLQRRLEAGAKAFTIASSNPGEGISTTAVNLALSFTQAGRQVLLVDANLRDPRLTSLFGVTRAPGFSELLLGTSAPEDAIRGVADFVTGSFSLEEIFLGPGMDRLHVMPCGQAGPAAGEPIASPALASVLADLRSRYDVILLDGPSLASAADSLILGRHSEIILVFSPDRTGRADLEGALSEYRKGECTVAGLFVNGLEVETAAVEVEPAAARAAVG